MQEQESVSHQAPWRALLVYMAVGLLWFGVGDVGLHYWVSDHLSYVRLQRAQDYLFVLISGSYAGWLVWRTQRAEGSRSQAMHHLAKGEEQLRLALEGSGSGMWEWDMVQRQHSFSPSVPAMLHYSGDNFARDFRFKPRLHPQDRALVGQAVRRGLSQGVPFQMMARVQCFDGQYRWFEVSGNRHVNEQGVPVRFSGIVIDKTAQRAEEERLRLTAAVAQHTAEGVVVTDAHSTIVWTNPAFTNLMGYQEGELIGQRPSVFKSGRHDKAFYDAMWAKLHHAGHWNGVIYNKRKSGEVFPERMSLNAVKDENGKITHYVCMFTDISVETQREEALAQLAHNDSLTGLANRGWFMRALTQLVDSPETPPTAESMAVILLNLDRFKDVNDSYGHAVGDEVLRHIARQVQSALRPGDLIGRMAGDEIVVLARQLHAAEDASEIAERLIEAAAQPWKSPDGFAVVVSVSAGICCYPQHAQQAQLLMQGAHAAVYGAKEGRGSSKRWCFFHEDMMLDARERIALESRLRHGFAMGHLQLHYQPQVDITTGRIMGCEALLRWNDPQEGLISPARFIPVAETTGLIGPIGAWVLQEACRQAKAWSDAGLPDMLMAVNVSLHQFVLTDIEAVTRQALAISGLPAARLELEITESALADRPDEALHVLRRLKALGVRVAIDDFGTGYSSLAHLKRFPIDLLKIDQGFVRDIPQSADDMAISRAVIAMGHSLGMQVLAEGVEEQAQLEFLRQHGCNFYQGYLRSKPLPAAAFAQMLQADMHSPDQALNSALEI